MGIVRRRRAIAGLESCHGHHHHQTTGEARGISPNWHRLVRSLPPASATSSGPSTSLPSFQCCTVVQRELELWALSSSYYCSTAARPSGNYQDCTVTVVYSTELLCRIASTAYILHANSRATNQGSPRPRPSGKQTQSPEPGTQTQRDRHTCRTQVLQKLLQPGKSEQTPVATGDNQVTRSNQGLSPAQAVPQKPPATRLPCSPPARNHVSNSSFPPANPANPAVHQLLVLLLLSSGHHHHCSDLYSAPSPPCSWTAEI